MSATHAPESTGPVQSTVRTNRGLVVLVAILTVITLGLAGWLVYTMADTPETALSDDVATVVEDYRDAWNGYDADAFLALVTSDYQFYATPGLPGDTAEETAAMISDEMPDISWAVTQVDSPQMTSGDGRIQVSMVNRLTSTSALAQGEGISVLTLVERDGTWKIQKHVFVGQ